MQYVSFGNLGFDISRLGFGMMRLPKIGEGENAVLDEERCVRLLRTAIDSGVTYVDTAYPYCNKQSEIVVGHALKNGYREKVKLATKLPVWLVETREDLDKMLDLQLQRLDVPYIDFYLLHALSKERWEKMKSLHALEFLDSAVRDGRIRYPAFSFHDDYAAFRDILTGYDWQMAQIQFNYLDIRHQAGLNGIRLAASRNVPLVVMEPLRGGALAKVPEDIQAVMDKSGRNWSPVEWAFRYVGNLKNVATILSGMSNEEQVEDNLRLFDHVVPDSLTEKDLRVVSRIRKVYRERMPIGCTGCSYCVPCPKGVDIPKIFAKYNEGCMFGQMERFTNPYANIVKDGHDASKCVRCGLCEKKCPQHLPIRDWLNEVRQASK